MPRDFSKHGDGHALSSTVHLDHSQALHSGEMGDGQGLGSTVKGIRSEEQTSREQRITACQVGQCPPARDAPSEGCGPITSVPPAAIPAARRAFDGACRGFLRPSRFLDSCAVSNPPRPQRTYCRASRTVDYSVPRSRGNWNDRTTTQVATILMLRGKEARLLSGPLGVPTRFRSPGVHGIFVGPTIPTP